MRKHVRESFTYTVVFCLGYLIACGGGNTVTSEGSSGGTTVTSTIPLMLNSNVRPAAIVQSATKSQSLLAAIFGSMRSARPAATITSPSAVGQSYESDCSNFSQNPNGPFGSIHAIWGNSGLVSMNYAFGVWGGCMQPQLIASVGGDENGNPQGYPIILDGTINTLVVYGAFVSGQRFRCTDTGNTSTVGDGSFVRAYYDLAHDAIILGSGTSQLTPTCRITIPPGDDVTYIAVQWLKS